MKTTGEFIREQYNRARTAALTIDCPGDGSMNARIAIVGEAPGEREAQMKMPLIGGAGNILWNAFKKINISRSNCYITNVIKRQITLSAKAHIKSPIDARELMTWHEFLKWELSQLPNVEIIVVLGSYAARAIIGHKEISKWRGSMVEKELHNGRTVKVFCMNNPANVRHDPKSEIIFQYDTHKLGMLVSGTYKPHVINPIINPTFDEAIEHIHNFHNEAVKHGTPICYDIETIAKETACIGLANDAHTGVCIAFRDTEKNIYTLEQDIQLYLAFQRLFKDTRCQFIVQNGAFDPVWLWFKDRIFVHGHKMDTLLAHHTLYPRLPHSLAFMTAQYTTHPYYKDDKDEWRGKEDIDQFWEYNVKDVCITFACHERLDKELKDQHLDEFFNSHVMPAQSHLNRMTIFGVPIEPEVKRKLYYIYRDEVARIEEDLLNYIRVATGIPSYQINVNSHTQLRKLLFDDLKLVGYGRSVGKINRQRILENSKTTDEARNILITLDEYTSKNKFLSTYADIPTDPDNRIRCTYKQFGVTKAPGRLSSAATPWGTGTNLQNQPELAQSMFVAPPGYCFGYFDLAQAEARCVAAEAKIEKWLEQFERARIDGSYDCHRALAADLFKMDYDDVPAYDRNPDGTYTLRYIAKRCRHGLNYRMQAMTLSIQAGIPYHIAVMAFQRYHEETPELEVWWADLIAEVRDKKCLYNAFGRRLLFLEPLDSPEALDAVVAFKPQSTIGDKVVRVITQSEEDPAWPIRSRPALNIHDALICIAPISKVKSCLRIMKKYAEEPIRINGIDMIIPAELKVSVPCDIIVDEESGKVHYEPNPKGVHCWGNLEKISL